ncbi:hypothetical protein GQ44DRAFT_823826 [Phaeosphaeriaceae sp. PMI808]|nr:hypothetical protein GQ44DRAFT_823826 [Phaeosphaeriaceae sp. PMI808]
MALETAAAIIGILAAAGTVAQILSPAVAAFGDATKNAAAVLSEVNQMRTILSALHGYLDDLEISPQERKQLIQVDQLVATLTDGVLLFSELEALALKLHKGGIGAVNRLQWLRNDGKFASIRSRMQCFKSSITIMLNILQCESDREANRSHSQLLAITSVLLSSNRELSMRLARLETGLGVEESIRTARPESVITTNTVTGNMHNLRMETINEDASTIPLFSLTDSQFEKVLMASKVYRKAKNFDIDASFRSSVVRSHAWTFLSDISLSDISSVSAIALPIFCKDISNMQHYRFREDNVEVETIMNIDTSDMTVHETPTENRSFEDPLFYSSRRETDKTLVMIGHASAHVQDLANKISIGFMSSSWAQTHYEKSYRLSGFRCDGSAFKIDILVTNPKYLNLPKATWRMKHALSFILVYNVSSESSVRYLQEVTSHLDWAKVREDQEVFVIGKDNDKRVQRVIDAAQLLSRTLGGVHFEIPADGSTTALDVFELIA